MSNNYHQLSNYRLPKLCLDSEHITKVEKPKAMPQAHKANKECTKTKTYDSKVRCMH